MKIFNAILICITFAVLTPTVSFAKLPKVEKGEPLPSDLFVELAKLVNPTVVNISTAQLPRHQINPNDPYFRFFENFFGPQELYQMQQKPRTSLGTGFIIRKDGLILTNNHVIDKADVIKVQLDEKDETLYEATVIGKDARTDIALIKINVKRDLPVAKLGSSANLEVGEWVAAFGNPYGHGHTMTKGILSARGRNINELNRFNFLQTDASINPGNSGGPLVNTRGEVIGVNTAIDARAQGIGFAIPIDDVKSILAQLESDGGVKRGYIGIYMDEVTPQAIQALDLKVDRGALVLRVIPGSPAEKAKLEPYDVILNFNGKRIHNVGDLMRAVENSSVGKPAVMKISRNGKEKSMRITIDEHPEQKLARTTKPVKKYRGQKAPFDLGFKVVDFNSRLAREWGIPKLRSPHPIVIEVIPNSAAAMAELRPGDVILDVNRRNTRKASDVLKSLRKGKHNILRVRRGENVVLIHLKVQ